MAIRNVNRLLFSGLTATYFALACSAQESPAPVNEASQPAPQASAEAPSATLLALPAAKPAKVTCAGNQLTISAANSTLGSVLAAVHTCLGIEVDIPEGASGSRVFEELGPGPPRQVLGSLLTGTDFDFAIRSSDTDPQKIETVLLMLRPTQTASAPDSDSGRSPSAARRAWSQSRQNRSASLSVDDNHPVPDEAPSTPDAESAEAAPAVDAGATPTQAQAGDASPVPAEASSASGDNTAPKAPSTPVSETSPTASPSSNPGQSTEQSIANMQQMFQQRRQMNQNPNPTSPQP